MLSSKKKITDMLVSTLNLLKDSLFPLTEVDRVCTAHRTEILALRQGHPAGRAVCTLPKALQQAEKGWGQDCNPAVALGPLPGRGGTCFAKAPSRPEVPYH